MKFSKGHSNTNPTFHFTGLIFFFLILFVSFHAQTQRLQIGIMRAFSTSSVLFTYGDGDYEFKSDSASICSMSKTDKIVLKRDGNQIRIYKNESSFGLYNRIFIHEKKQNSHISILCTAPVSKKVRKYMNDFIITTEGTSNLKIVNDVEMENYLAGVIESEGGGGKHLEYYKVQAVLSRTYALDHLMKHYKDSFQLCDAVHCQAYLNMMRFTPTIKQAVSETKGIIMIAPDFKLAKGFFFANCGGQTSESDFVWNESVPYCKSVRDTFCIHSRQATWEKKIPKQQWKEYLVNHFGFPVSDSIVGPALYYFEQPWRTAFFLSPRLGIPLRDLREKFNLKSTWFSCSLVGDELVLRGRGFGHGVGLCQEGAMQMAKYGFTYEQILKFYFTGIEFFNYSDWHFLRQKVKDSVEL